MMIEATLQEVDSGKVWDVSELIEGSMKWSTQLESSFPGKLDVNIMDDGQVNISNGDDLTLKIDGQNVFKGKVRKRGVPSSGGIPLSVYDNKYLLKSKDTIVFGAGTAASRFAQVCQIANIPHAIINVSGHSCSENVADAKSFHDMVQTAIDETRKATKERYAISDNFGTLEFFNLNHLITNIVLGDESLVKDFDFESSIEDLFNSIKVIKEDSEKKERQIAIAKDDTNVRRLGLLQDVVSPEDSEMNQAQMQNQASNLLSESNKEKKTLKLNCIGQLGIKAGSTITLQLKKLESEGLYDKPFLITKCDHDFGKTHTMSLELEVV